MIFIKGIKPALQNAAQIALNEHASFDVPPIPLTVSDISITLKPSDLKISTFDNDLLGLKKIFFGSQPCSCRIICFHIVNIINLRYTVSRLETMGYGNECYFKGAI